MITDLAAMQRVIAGDWIGIAEDVFDLRRQLTRAVTRRLGMPVMSVTKVPALRGGARYAAPVGRRLRWRLLS
jgi:hypothetical protein